MTDWTNIVPPSPRPGGSSTAAAPSAATICHFLFMSSAAARRSAFNSGLRPPAGPAPGKSAFASLSRS